MVSIGRCNTICYEGCSLKVVLYEARETVWTFCAREERNLASLEGRADAA